MKIAILSRGPKLYSTESMVKAIKRHGHEALVIDHTRCHVIIEQGKPNVLYKGKYLDDLDAIIPRIGASVTFFGAAVVRQFEMMHVFSANESQSIVRSRDKLRTLQLLSRAGLGIPKTVFAKYPKDKDIDNLITLAGGVPLIVKLLEGTQGIGVMLVENAKTAKAGIETFSGLKTNVLIQEYIQESKGSDIRAFVVDGQVVGAMKRQGKEGEFRSNLHRGGKGTIIELSKQEEATAIQATKVLGLSIAGVDMLQSERGPLILEVNSSPGLQGIETVTKNDIAGSIVEFVERNVVPRSK